MRTMLMSAALLVAGAAQAVPGSAPAAKAMTAEQHANEGYKHQNMARTPGTDRAMHWARAAEHYRMAAQLARKEGGRNAPAGAR